MADTKFKLAILIDGDNAEAKLIEQMINEASKFGRVTIKRIYADWTTQHMNSWKNKLNKFAIRPMQKFSYTTGKNSTDSALIIDAMDIMHSKLVDGFCIVSSDSDYTGIAQRLREEGLFVMGMGKSHTPEAFVKSCENFTYTEILTPSSENKTPSVTAEEKPKQTKEEVKKNHTEKIKSPAQVVKKSALPLLTNKITNQPIDITLIDNAFEMVVNDNTGLALAAQLIEAIRKIDSTFDPRNFGYNSFRKFLSALSPKYEIVLHDDKTTISVRKKE
ncbi:MAG: NYN domain-containing protein [Bacteroidia bacterium]